MVLYAWCVGKDVLLFVRHLSMVIDFVDKQSWMPTDVYIFSYFLHIFK